jgi:hypothetical protein
MMPAKPTNLFLANRCFLNQKMMLAVYIHCNKGAPENLKTTHQGQCRLKKAALAILGCPFPSQKQLYKLIIKSPV